MSKAKPMIFSVQSSSNYSHKPYNRSTHRGCRRIERMPKRSSLVINKNNGCECSRQISLNLVLNKKKQDGLYALFLESKIKFYRECVGIGLTTKFMDSLFEHFIHKQRECKSTH